MRYFSWLYWNMSNSQGKLTESQFRVLPSAGVLKHLLRISHSQADWQELGSSQKCTPKGKRQFNHVKKAKPALAGKSMISVFLKFKFYIFSEENLLGKSQQTATLSSLQITELLTKINPVSLLWVRYWSTFKGWVPLFRQVRGLGRSSGEDQMLIWQRKEEDAQCKGMFLPADQRESSSSNGFHLNTQLSCLLFLVKEYWP